MCGTSGRWRAWSACKRAGRDLRCGPSAEYDAIMRSTVAGFAACMCLCLVAGCASTDKQDGFASSAPKPLTERLSFDWFKDLFKWADPSTDPDRASAMFPGNSEPFEFTGDFKPQPWP